MAPSRRKGASKATAAAARRQWKIGDLVLAKVKGFPAWPATVSEPEKWGYSSDWKKVLVYFFGTQQIAFCNPSDVEAFTEEKKESLLVKRQGKGADFVRAVQEIIDSYEKSKKQDQADELNSGNEVMATNDRHLLDSTKNIELQDQEETETETLELRLKSSFSANDTSEANVVVDDTEAATKIDSLQDKETLLEETCGSAVVTETPLVATYSSRRRSAALREQDGVVQGSTPSVRKSRSSSRAEPCRLQNSVMPSNDDSNNGGNTAPNVTMSGYFRRKKRIRKSPDASKCPDGGFPAFVSNGSAEENNSEIVTVSSESFSLNEGNTMENGCNLENPDAIVECLDGGNELSKGLDLQTQAVVIKKKRKPSRKRVTNGVAEQTMRLTKEEGLSVGVCDTRQPLQPSCERLNEKDPKEDGDEHLPFVKRARVRKGTPLSIEEELDCSMQIEGKPTANKSGQMNMLNCNSDDPSDKNSFAMKGTSGNISPSKDCVQHWKVNTNQSFGCLADGEAALPPSKRLHRALEAMSANAVEEGQTSDETSTTVKKLVNGCSASSTSACLQVAMESKDMNVLRLQSVDTLCNNASQIGASVLFTTSNLVISGETTNSLGADLCSQPIKGSKGPKHDICNDVSEDDVGCSNGTDLSGLSFGAHTVQSTIHTQTLNDFSPNPSSLYNVLPLHDKSNNDKVEVGNCRAENPGTLEHPAKSPDPALAADEIPKVSTGNCTNMLKYTEEVGGMNTQSLKSQVDSLYEVANRIEHKEIRKDTSSSCISDDHLCHKDVSGIQSSSSPIDGVDFPLRQSLPVADEEKVESAAFPYRPRSVDKCSNHVATHAALSSFEATLGTLTRTKESIGRATRIAIDCAKFGVAAKVMEIVARNLESESSLPKRVDLFFLVDSISQCSRGLKGDFGGIYPSVIKSLLPRLLSAAAPSGHAAQENRKQCIKVLRLWMQRRILPESIIHHHIRELESLGVSSSSGAYARRSCRTERSLDDPIREMEGMHVDEYGSNSSFQLPGFCLAHMLKDVDEGSDSDGGSFEAVTPEHNQESPEEQETTHVVEKHRHILEDVDGELEMEDVAPISEFEISSTNSITGDSTRQHSHDALEQHFVVPFAPPPPQDVLPSSPPLPAFLPPPPPPPPCLPHPCATSDPYTNVDSKVYPGTSNVQNNLQHSRDQQLVVPRSRPTISDVHYHVPECRDSQIPLQMTDPTNSFGSFSARPANNGHQMDSARFHVKPHPPRPPHPLPSSQFSYVQADQHVKSRRDAPPPYFSNKFHFGHNMDNGKYYNNHDRMKPAPYELRDSWRHHAPSLYVGPQYPDKDRISYPPALYPRPPREPPRLPHQEWPPPPPWLMSNRNSMPRPPPEAPRYWRPR